VRGKSDILTLSNSDLIHQMAGELRDLKKVRATPSWPRSWANFSLF
jgi:hypothetical protein